MTSIALVANEGRMPRTVVAVAVPEHPEMKVTFRSFPVASAADEGVLSPDQPFTVAPNDSTVIMLQVPGLTIPTYVRPDGGPAYQALLNDGTKVWLPLRKSSARENIPQAVLNRASQVAREANCSTS